MFKINVIFARIISIEPIKRQSIISFIWKIVFTFIGFLSTIYFAHSVGASVLGAYFLFVAYFGIINLVSDGGFGGAAIKRISEGEDQDAYFSAFVVLRSVFVTVVIVALLAFRDSFVDLNDTGMFNWLLVALLSSLVYGSLHSGLAGCGKIGIQSTCGFITEITRIFVQVIAIFLGYEATGLAGGFVAGMIVASIIELRLFDLHITYFSWRHVKSLSIFSFWLFLTSSGVMVYSYADTIMIGYFMSNTDVGIYRIVLQFTAIATLATTSIQMALWPKVSHWSKIKNIKLIEKSLSKAISYALLLAIPLCGGGILLGDMLLYYMYGAEFAKGYYILIVLLIVQIINVFQYFFLAYLSALDLQKDAFKVTSISTIANIFLNAALIPIMGIGGAAIATFVTLSLNAILAWRVLKQVIIVKVEYNSLWNILKASGIMWFIVGGSRLIVPISSVWVLLVLVALGVISYFVLVLKFDRMIYEELKNILMHMNIL